MRGLQHEKKLFYDLEKAKQFGDEVEKIASEIIVQTGKRTYYSILGKPQIRGNDYEVIGRCYYINKDKGLRDQDVYHIHYSFAHLPQASKADLLEARRQAKERLDQKYQELGPDIGISRA